MEQFCKLWKINIGRITAALTMMHKRSISIELANWGHRTKYVTGDRKYTHTTSWRGKESFEKYDEKQVKATIELLNYLCEKYRIPKTIPADFCPEKAIDLESCGISMELCAIRILKVILNGICTLILRNTKIGLQKQVLNLLVNLKIRIKTLFASSSCCAFWLFHRIFVLD